MLQSQKNKRRRSYRSNQLKFSKLEDRNMLASVTFDAGIVTVNGTAADDTIVLSGNLDFQSFTVTIISDSDATVIEDFNRNEVDRVIVFAGDGDDLVINTLLTPTEINGEGGNDSLEGGFANDSLFGGQGNDVLLGRNGDDLLDGQGGDDTLSGVNGNDTLLGSAGNDVLNGNNGDDIIIGGLGDDTLLGQAGNDVLNGNGDDDVIFGGDGDDVVNGGTGLDNIFGGDGEDTINGNGDNDTIRGGAGDDKVIGGSGDDIIIGGSGDDTLEGLGGNDIINGNGNDDTISGGNGDDVVNGGTGVDNIFGDNGEDTLNGNGGNDTIHGGAGDDRIRGGSGDDRLIGANGDDNVGGSAGNDFVAGNAGNDELLGGRGDDLLFGGLGDDGLLFGGAGNDRIDGGEGTDNSFYISSEFENRITEVGENFQVTDFRIQDSRFILENGTDLLIGIETVDFTDDFEPTPIEDVVLETVVERVVVQPILVSDNDGSNRSSFFGPPIEEAETLARIDRVFNQAGVDVQFLDAVPFNNTFVNSGFTEERPASDLPAIISAGEAAGVVNDDPNVINIFFVQNAPGTAISGISPVNAAVLNGNGVVLEVVDLLESAGNRQRNAFATVQGIARNLGLTPTLGANNVLNPEIVGIGSSAGDLEPFFTPSQSEQIIESDFTRPV